MYFYKYPLIDLHCDVLGKLSSAKAFLHTAPGRHCDLPRLQDSGLWAMVWSLFVPPHDGKDKTQWWHAANLQLDIFYEIAELCSDQLALARSTSELLSNKEKGKVSIILELEGLHPIGSDLTRLKLLYERGVRIFTITWNNSNLLATSCVDAEKSNDKGLTEPGREAIELIADIGGVLDFSHASPKTFDNAASMLAERQIIFSHSCVNELKQSSRNITDAQIRTIVAKQGLIGVNFFPEFLCTRASRCSVEDIIDHIEYIIDQGNEDIVGFGSDFDGVPYLPRGVKDITSLKKIAARLCRRGLPQTTVAKVCGENFLNFFKSFP